MIYSNPRLHAVMEDWPMGGSQRGVATFDIQTTKRGQRVSRTTLHKGHTGKPKTGVYHDACRIVDGDDGKTYIIGMSANYRMVNIMESNLKYSSESVHNSDSDGRYDQLVKLFADEVSSQ